MLAQGFPGWRRHLIPRGWGIAVMALMAMIVAVAPSTAWAQAPAPADRQGDTGCAALARRWQPVTPQVWWWAGFPGDADAANRGLTTNLLAVRQAGRVWLLGAGPSPAAARGLACGLRARTGWRVTDVILPWARPEQVLGGSGWPGAIRWAHADVAARMRQACAACEQALRLRLADAQLDLGSGPVPWPDRVMTGDAGQLGPFEWWRLWRAPGVAVTVFRVRGSGLWAAQGLLWGDGPVDLREADPQWVALGLERLDRGLAPPARPDLALRWLPEQGAWLDADAPAQQAAYLQRLMAAVRARQAAGTLEAEPAQAVLEGPDWLRLRAGPRHALNWQRVWRLLERAGFDAAGEP